MNDFKNKKVVIMGLGLHGGGVSAANFFLKQGSEVLITDLKTEEELKESIDKIKEKNIKYSLGGHKEEDFLSADLIIKNPDVSNNSHFLEIARKNKIPIETDTSLFFKFSKARIIGVTGTKGKSTVASLIKHLLKPKYKRVFLAGNICLSPFEIIFKAKKNDIVVLELSSFELESIDRSPNIAVITNIMEDHLNRYSDMKSYILSKKIIFKYQNKNDILILNYDDKITRNFSLKSPSKVYFYSLKGKPENPGAYLKEGKIYFNGRKKATMDIKNFKLYGEHNISNLLAAVSVAKILKVSCNSIEKSIKSFKGVHSRQELVGEVDGIKYFNDTTATMPEAVIKAIKAFKSEFPNSKLILIAGGQNKGLSYRKMAEEIMKNIDSLILLPGTASDEIKKELDNFKIHFASSMEEAVMISKAIASCGDIVFLSPGAASFNLFKNEFDRGDQFKNSVKNLK